MEDNIDSKVVGNRRFIIELRFDYNAFFFDKKGSIIESIKKLNLFPSFQWEVGMAEISIFDNKERSELRNLVTVNTNRFSFMSSKIDSIGKFYDDYDRIYTIIINEIGELTVRRIGCRIQGTYKTKSKDFHTILGKMKYDFPAQFYLEGYPMTDMSFQLNYENGMYRIGPINKTKDPFVEQNFTFKERENHVGVAIDTDNYLTNEKQPINEKKLIKDTLTLSLSIEKDLYSNIKDF